MKSIFSRLMMGSATVALGLTGAVMAGAPAMASSAPTCSNNTDNNPPTCATAPWTVTAGMTVLDGNTQPSYSASSLSVAPDNGQTAGVSLVNGVTLNDDAIIGDSGTGTMTVADSTHNVTGNLILGNQSTGVGNYSITGDNAVLNVNFNLGGNGPSDPVGSNGRDGQTYAPFLNANGALIVGQFGSGTFVQGDEIGKATGPSVTVAGDLILGHQGLAGNPDSVADSAGSYTLNNGTLMVGGSIGVGAASTGTNGTNIFVQNGGSVNITGAAGGERLDQMNGDYVGVGTSDHAGELFIGGAAGYDNDGGAGEYDIHGGSLTVGLIEDGHAGTGTMVQTGGTVNASLWMGNAGGSQGTYMLSGGTINAGTEEIGLGGGGSSVFTQTGGINNTGSMTVGDNFGTTGEYDLSGDPSTVQLNVTGTLTLAALGQATFNQSGGTVNAGALVLGQSGTTPSPTGNYNLSGNGVLAVTGDETIGSLGFGNFTQGVAADAGATTNTIGGNLIISDGAIVTVDGGPVDTTRAGLYTLNTGALSAANIIVGSQGIAEFDQNGGLNTVANQLTIGDQNVPLARGCGSYGPPDQTTCNVGGAAQGTYKMTAGMLMTNGTIIGNAGIGELDQTGGAFTSGTGGATRGDLVIGAQAGIPAHMSPIDPGNPGGATFSVPDQAGGTGTYNLGLTGQDSSSAPTSQIYGDVTLGRDSADGLPASGTLAIAGDGTAMNVNQYTGFDSHNGGNLIVGLDGTGAVTQADQSTVYLDHSLVLGANATGSGSYTLSATSITDGSNSGYNLFVGSDLNIGGQQTDAYGYNAQTTAAGGKGTFTQTSGDVSVVGTVNIGNYGGSGTYGQSGGTVTTGGLVVGNSGTGEYDLSGTADVTLTASQAVVGAFGGSVGTFKQTGGTFNANFLNVGIFTGGVGTYAMSAGNLNVAGNLGLGGPNAQGTFTQSDGTVEAGGLFVNNDNEGTSGGNYSISGGSLMVGGVSYIGNGADDGIATAGLGGLFTQTGGQVTFSSALNIGIGLNTSGVGEIGSACPANPSPCIASGAYTMSGGTASIEALNVGGGSAGSTGTFTMNANPSDSPAPDSALDPLVNTTSLTIATGGSVQINGGLMTVGATSTSGQGGSLNVGSAGTASVLGGSLSVANTLTVGIGGGSALFTQTGGTVTVGSNLIVGNAAGDHGTYELTAGGVVTVNAPDAVPPSTFVSDFTFVGLNGSGTFLNDDGTHNTDVLVIGAAGGSSGLYTLQNGGSVNVGTASNSGFLDVGEHGQGTYTQTGGTTTVIGALDLGRCGSAIGCLGVGDTDTGAGNGTVNLSGGSVSVSQFAVVGDSGTGLFAQTSDATATIGGELDIGRTGGTGTYNLGDTASLTVGSNATGGSIVLGNTGSSGAFNLTGSGSVTVTAGTDPQSGTIFVGTAGTGMFTQSGTSAVSAANVSIGNNTGGVGTYNLSGGGLTLSNELFVGGEGQGTFAQSGASSTVTTGFLSVGNNAGGVGNYNLSAGSLTAFADTFLGGDNLAQGTITQTGGTAALDGNVNVGYAAGATGIYTLGGNGTATIGGNLDIGVAANATGTFNLSAGGSLSVSGDEIVGDAGTGKFDQTGGTHTVTGTITIQQNPGSIGEFDLANATVTAGHITNNGTFSGFGTATTSSGAQLANTGLVHATGGTLTVTPGISGPTGNITIDSGAGLNLSSATTGSSVATLTDRGAMNLGSQNVTVSSDYNNTNFGSGNSFNKHANVTTSGGQIDAAGNVGVSVSGTGGTVITGGTTATPTLALGNVHVGATTNATFNVNNTGSSGPVLRGAIQNTGLTAAGLSLTAANFGPIALGGSQAETLSATIATAGSLSGQSFKVATNFDNVQDQTVSVTGTAYRLAAGSEAPNPVTVVNQHVGGTASQALTISNTAANDGFSEKLDASFGSNTGNVTNNSGTISLLGPTASNSSSLSVGVDTSSAGHKTGSATVNYVSDGTGTSGLGLTAAGSSAVTVSGDVYRLAAASTVTPSPVTLANVRVGTTDSQALSLSNTAANDGFSEKLDASIGGATGSATTNNGSISLLAAGATNSSSLTVGVDTSSAGHKSGSAAITLTSDGAGTSGLASTSLGTQTVNVSGDVYRTAAGSVVAPIAIANQHVGGSATQALSVSNTAANDGFSEKLDASFGANTGNVTNNGGSISLLGATATNNTSLSVGVDTSSAGAKSGTTTVNFASNGTGTSGLASIGAGSQAVTVTGNVYNLASSSTIAPINLGVVHVGQGGGSVSQGISITNTAAAGAFSEGLDSSFGSYTNNGGTLNPTFNGSITNLTAGSTDASSLQVTLNTSTAGSVSGNIIVHQGSNGTIDGLANTALADQNPAVSGSVIATITNLAVAQVNTAQPVNFGNVRAGTVVASQALSITNAAPSGAFTENLIGNVVGTSNGTVTASGGFGPPTANPELAGGETDTTHVLVGIDTSTAGAKTGNAIIDFKSDGTSFSGGTITDLGNTNVAVQGNVYRLATGSATTPADLGSVRVGGTLSGNISVTNTAAADGFSENLDASITASTLQVSSATGTVTGLSAGSSNNSGLQVALNTGTSGAISGTATVQFMSDGSGIDGGAPVNNGSQVVTVTGKVYQTAVASVSPNPVDFGIIHVNQAAVQTVTVANTASGALTDAITGGFSSVTGSFTGSGTLGAGVAAGGNSGGALQVGLNVATAGAYSGTANLGLASHDADLSDVALATAGIGLEAQVNNYASLYFSHTGGQGSLSGAGSAFTLDFGDLLQNSGSMEAILAIFNCPSCDPAFTDLLSTAGIVSNGYGYSLSGDSVTDLAGGASQGGFDIGLGTDVLGEFTETLTFAIDSSDPDFNSVIGDVTLTLRGNVVSSTVTSAPEPPSLVIFGTAIFGLGFLSVLRRRKRVA